MAKVVDIDSTGFFSIKCSHTFEKNTKKSLTSIQIFCSDFFLEEGGMLLRQDRQSVPSKNLVSVLVDKAFHNKADRNRTLMLSSGLSYFEFSLEFDE